MYIDTLKLKSFGPIEELSLKFNRKGINLVFGNNGTGKTQIVSGIIGAISPCPELFIKSNRQVETDSELIISLIENNQVENILISKSPESESGLFVVKNNAGKLSEKIYEVGKNEKMPSLFFNLSPHSKSLDKNSILAILKGVPDGISATLWNTISNIIIEGMNSPIISGWPYIFLFAEEIHLRRKYSNSIPLLIDLPTLFDTEYIQLLIDILSELAKHDQVILFLKEEDNLRQSIDENQILYVLPNKVSSQKHYLSGESNADNVWQKLNYKNGS